MTTTKKTITRLDMANAILDTSGPKTGTQFAKTHENLVFLLAWAWAERGETPAPPDFNMLDTEEPAPDATTAVATNESGLGGPKNYTSLAEGVTATLKVLFRTERTVYGSIIEALVKGNSALYAAGLAELSTWGTGQFQSIVTECEDDFTKFGEISVGTEEVEEDDTTTSDDKSTSDEDTTTVTDDAKDDTLSVDVPTDYPTKESFTYKFRTGHTITVTLES